LFWVALGATAGVVAVRRLGRVARAYGPEGLSRSAAGLADAVRETGLVVRAGMAEREEQLRLALGIDAGTLTAAQAGEGAGRPAGTAADPEGDDEFAELDRFDIPGGPRPYRTPGGLGDRRPPAGDTTPDPAAQI
jgi:hypothetical protein